MPGEDDGSAAKVTVLMPLKDPHPAYLEIALTSVFEQTSPRWQLLVVAESDELASCRSQLGARANDERVRVVANEGRRLAGAINTGMRQATTEFVGLLFGDDLWHRSAVATLERCIDDDPSADFFHSGRQVIDDEGRPISSVHPARPDVTLADFESAAPVKHLLCWRRELGLSVGGLDERSRSVGPDDFDFPWTMAEHGARFSAVDACLYLYRDHRAADRLTTHLPLSVHVSELRRIFRKHGLDRRTSRERLQDARRTYLQQCLYRSPADRWLRRRLRRPAGPAWRDTYR